MYKRQGLVGRPRGGGGDVERPDSERSEGDRVVRPVSIRLSGTLSAPATSLSSWLTVGDLPKSTGGGWRGGMGAPKSETESRSREDSSRNGEGTDADTGGTTRVISLVFALAFGTALDGPFFVGAEVEEEGTSDEDFFPAGNFLDFPLEGFLDTSLDVEGGEEETKVTSERTVETDWTDSISDGCEADRVRFHRKYLRRC